VDTATVDGVWTRRGSVDEAGVPHAAFVVLDLLALDGESLLDVPFQERRRLLESVVGDGRAIRTGPIVKQPLERWLPGWREAGFTHYLARHQNARYHPGQQRDDWLRIPLSAPPAPGLAQRLVGSRRRTRRIAD
jgi:ATP-dependent DNA ligase